MGTSDACPRQNYLMYAGSTLMKSNVLVKKCLSPDIQCLSPAKTVWIGLTRTSSTNRITYIRMTDLMVANLFL